VQALQEGASEIHFDQAAAGQHRVRYRIHGVLVDRAGHPAELHAPLLNWLREFAGLARKAPASAATTARVGGVEVHAVVSIVPAVGGPTATVTLFPHRDGAPDLVPLGLESRTIEALAGAIQRPRGALVIGCEDPLLRATLMRGVLSETPRGKVWALETLPVYRNPAIAQTAIGSSAEAAGLLAGPSWAGADLVVVDDASHASTLRACLECARTQTVVVGHPQGDLAGLAAQVIAVAGGALAASTVTGLAAARKVRLLCPECKQRLRPAEGKGGRRTFTPHGCASCAFTGFRGQRAITGVWLLGPGDRARLRGGRPAGMPAELAAAVTAAMRIQGHALLDDGLTSIEELSGALTEP